MAPEHKQRSIAQELTGGVAGEYALLSFLEKKRGEVLRKAACVWVENLEQKIVDTLDHNDRLECTNCSHVKAFACMQPCRQYNNMNFLV